MNQSSFIAGTLLAAFVLFIAAKGHLGNYTAVLWGNTAAPVPSGSGSSSSGSGGISSIAGGGSGGGGGGSSYSQYIQYAEIAAAFA